jgi:hypothetical protein
MYNIDSLLPQNVRQAVRDAPVEAGPSTEDPHRKSIRAEFFT